MGAESIFIKEANKKIGGLNMDDEELPQLDADNRNDESDEVSYITDPPSQNHAFTLPQRMMQYPVKRYVGIQDCHIRDWQLHVSTLVKSYLL